MKVTTKGQVTVPQELRQKMGILPNTEVEFLVRGRDLILRKVPRQSARGHRLIEHLRARGNQRLSTDQIMALTRGE